VRLTEDPAPAYGDPDTTSDAAAVAAKLGPVRLQAKALKAWVTIPNDLIRYSSPSVEVLVRMALAGKFAVAEDQYFLEGVGSSIAPKGIITYGMSAAETPTIGKVTLHVAKTVGGSGDTFEPEDVANIQALYYMGNDPDPPTGWIMRPLLWAAIMNRRASIDVSAVATPLGPFMFNLSRGDAASGLPTQLGNTNVYPTVQASNNRVKSATNLVYVLFGNFRRCIIGRVGTMELAVSEHVRFLQDKLVIRAVERHDLGLEHEESFVFTDTLLES
jgi:HK97 family phage major capsid protein